MPSAPSGFEVEELHRRMIRASAVAAGLDQRLQRELRSDAVRAGLRHWVELAGSIQLAVQGCQTALLRAGTSAERLDRIRDRLGELKARAGKFDMDPDLDACVQHWKTLAQELAQLPGPHRDGLVRLLEAGRASIDQTTAALSQARRAGGLLPADRKLAQLTAERDRAREKHQQLRRDYLAAEQAHRSRPRVPAVRSAAREGDLGGAIVEARQMRGAPALPHRLGALLDRDARHRWPATAQVQQTLRHLATAGHRTLTDPSAGELRANLARLDAILARLGGGGEAVEGAQEIGRTLQRMGAIAASPGGAPHLAQFQRLIDERRGQLRAVVQRGQKPLSPADGQRGPEGGRHREPGLDRLLRDSSQAQLAAQLAKAGAGALQRLSPARPPASALGGVAQSLAGDAGGGPPFDGRRVLSGLQRATSGAALHELAKKGEEKDRLAALSRRPRGSARALLDAFQQHPQGQGMARHLQAGGALRSLCEVAQRGHGLPIGKAAQHYLAARGSSPLWSAVQTFHSLVRGGHQPRCWSLSSIAHAFKDDVSSALHDASSTVGRAPGLAAAAAQTVRQGVSGFAGGAASLARRGQGLGSRALLGAEGAISRGARALEDGGERWVRAGWGGVRSAQGSLAQVAHSGMQALHAGGHWAQGKVGEAGHWSRDKVHAGLEWLRKTGVVGAVGTGLRPGFSSLGRALAPAPLGLAVRSAQKTADWARHGGLARAWHGAEHLAGRGLEGLKTATRATSQFLQSPGGQLLVTGLSLAASFIPGGLVVKAVIGGGIGALQALSEGKDWKGVLTSAAGGALTGALPFMKLGPFAKLGLGALQGGLTALASGGSFKDALKNAAGGALDSVDPGAFHALKKLKGFTTAEKLLQGKSLSKAEKALLERGKLAAPLRALEKAMSSPRMRRSMGALERAAGKAVKGGVWVSGKAARAQHLLDQAVGAGDQIQSVLSQVHELAPGLAEALGDNAAGHFAGALGDWAGKGDHALSGALQRGHQASNALHDSRGYLDQGLGFAGAKDPHQARHRRRAHDGRRSLEHVEALRRGRRGHHPELDLARAAGKRARGEHGEVDPPRRRMTPGAGSLLEHALARGRKLVHQGEAVAQGVHGGLGQLHATVARGLADADRIQRGLEEAARLARSGAGILGEDSEWGSHLLELSDHADRIHGYLQQGIDLAGAFDRKVEGVEAGLERIPGVHARSPLEKATHLEGRRLRKGHPHPDERGGEVSHPVDLPPREAAHVPGQAARVGHEVGGGLDQAARLASALAKMLGEDAPVAHLAGQLGEAARGGHDKLHEALGMAAGKSSLGKGRELLRHGLSEAEAHHRKKLARAHPGKLPGALARDLHALGDDGGRLAHDLDQTGKDARHALRDAQRFSRDGRKLVHSAEHLWTDAQHFGESGQQAWAGAQTVWGDLRSGRLGDALTHGQELFADLQGLFAEGQGLVGEGRGVFRQGSKVAREGEGLAHDAQDLRGDARGLARDGRRALADGQRLGADAFALVRGTGIERGSIVQAAHRGLGEPGEATSAIPNRAGRKAGDAGFSGLPSHGRRHRAGQDDSDVGLLEEGRLHVHRGGLRGAAVQDGQGVDSAAPDTWIGSGEGVKLFSEVFGAFLPAEVASAASQRGVGRRHGHHRHGGHGGDRGRAHAQGRTGFFKGLFDRLHGFADRIAGWAETGEGVLGEGMHLAERGMHGLGWLEGAAVEAQGMAGKAEGFLDRLGLHQIGSLAGRIGDAAGWVDGQATRVHGGLKKADRWMGRGKSIAGEVGEGARSASGFFAEAAGGQPGSLLHLFKSSRSGEGIDGRTAPEKVRLGSALDEPRRLDVTTLSRMEGFLGGSLSGVRIHTGPGAAEVTSRFNAEAVTVQDHIFFAPGRFNPGSSEGQRLLAHELTHVLQKGRPNLDVRTAETEALRAEHGFGSSPEMTTLDLRQPRPDWKLPDGMGTANQGGVHTAKRNRSRGDDAAAMDTPPDGEESLEQISGRVYDLLMEELEHSFESR